MNLQPTRDLDKYGTELVKKGKITQATLDKLYRREAAHQNTMSNLPFFWFAVVRDLLFPPSLLFL